MLNQLSVYGGYFSSPRKVVPVRASWRWKTAFQRELSLDKAKEVSACLRIGGVGEELEISQFLRPLRGQNLIDEVGLANALMEHMDRPSSEACKSLESRPTSDARRVF